MAIQFATLNPLSPSIKQNPLPIQRGISVSLPRRTQLLSRAAASVSAPWEEQIPPNALRRKRDPSWRGGFSLGVDLGLSRTGVALSKGFSVRPLTVLELRGQKLELRLLDIAEKQEVDEFIIGLPKSGEGKETEQSNKVRSVAGGLQFELQRENSSFPRGCLQEMLVCGSYEFPIQSQESSYTRMKLISKCSTPPIIKGWRVYLQDEHGTSAEALDHMIAKGLSRSARGERIDAYAAVKVLERYFSHSGKGIELVVPKQVELQKKLRQGPPKDVDFFPDD
ncbi:UNVERIFIED_CONTAM: hypothetical protein Sradi_3250500 [Sesamum radiatum]|uniref:YqgF/RNase H-like domain-containing protein n=1 Tax=Sesamum radiatum TaxID=300843 RepID=A0AAW2QZS7_SESRA